jgi:hypothetical protein
MEQLTGRAADVINYPPINEKKKVHLDLQPDK